MAAGLPVAGNQAHGSQTGALFVLASQGVLSPSTDTCMLFCSHPATVAACITGGHEVDKSMLVRPVNLKFKFI